MNSPRAPHGQAVGTETAGSAPRPSFAGSRGRVLLALLLAIVMGALTLLSASAIGASFLNWSRNLEPAVGQFLNPALIALAGTFLALGVLRRRGHASRRKP